MNGYAQPFSVITGARLKSDNRCTVRAGESRTELKIEQDFVPFSFSSSGQVEAPLVFAGYGATAEEFHYDDYAGIDVKDKIVVVLRYEPSGFADKSGNHGLTQHSQLITKAINARNHGAKAVLILNGKLGDGEEDLLTRFGSVSGPENVGLVMVQVKNAVRRFLVLVRGKIFEGYAGSNQFQHQAKLLRLSGNSPPRSKHRYRNHARHGEQCAGVAAGTDR